MIDWLNSAFPMSNLTGILVLFLIALNVILTVAVNWGMSVAIRKHTHDFKPDPETGRLLRMLSGHTRMIAELEAKLKKRKR